MKEALPHLTGGGERAMMWEEVADVGSRRPDDRGDRRGAEWEEEGLRAES